MNSMSYLILTINPGSTSTKIALFEDEQELFSESIVHSTEELAAFPDILDQLTYREQAVTQVLKEKGIDLKSLSAIVARGGILPPIQAGAYLINDKMIRDLKRPGAGHASNLAAMIADEMAIGMINNKTTACRLIPAFGKTVGDTINYGGLLGEAPVMDVPRFSSTRFARRGGRIPAPIHSLKN